MYLIIGKVDIHIEENHGNKYLVFDSPELHSTRENKKVLKSTQSFGMGLNKPLKLHLLTITVRCIFEEDGKFYSQLYLDNCCMSYVSQTTYKCWNMINLLFQKELMLIRRVHQKNVIFVIISILRILVLSMNHVFAMVVII